MSNSAFNKHRNFDNKVGDELRKFNEMVEHEHVTVGQAALVRPLMETMRSLVNDSLEIADDGSFNKHRSFDQKINDELRKFNEYVEHGHLNLEQAALVRPLMESLRSLVYDGLEQPAE